MKIVCVEPIGISDERSVRIGKLFSDLGHNFVFYRDRNEDRGELVDRMREADVVIVSNIRLDRALLSECKNLKMLSVAFAGLDHLDVDYCRERGICVRNAAGYSDVAVSELTIGLIIDVLRKVTELDYAMRNEKDRCGFLGRELCGMTVGVIGTGGIGSRVAKLLQLLGCNVLAYSRSEKQELKDVGVRYVSLDELLSSSDVVTLHVPCNGDTRHLIGCKELKKMKDSAILINCARGGVVDTEALHAALVNGDIAGAGIDVFDVEPPLSYEDLIMQAPNCVITPHVGYATQEAFERRIEIVVRNVENWLRENC